MFYGLQGTFHGLSVIFNVLEKFPSSGTIFITKTGSSHRETNQENKIGGSHMDLFLDQKFQYNDPCESWWAVMQQEPTVYSWCWGHTWTTCFQNVQIIIASDSYILWDELIMDNILAIEETQINITLFSQFCNQFLGFWRFQLSILGCLIERSIPRILGSYRQL